MQLYRGARREARGARGEGRGWVSDVVLKNSHLYYLDGDMETCFAERRAAAIKDTVVRVDKTEGKVNV